MAAPPPPPPQNKSDVDFWLDRASAAGRDPSAITRPQGTGAWSSGFLECFTPVDLCCVTCCCPCITFGKTHHRLHKDANLAGYSPLNGSCLTWYLASCFGFHFIPSLLQRTEIRQLPQPNLRGNFPKDFLKAWCCHCCDLMQQDKEAQHLIATGAIQPGTVVQPPKTEGMSYAPPPTQQQYPQQPQQY